jgi:hypothetical protein
MGERSEGLGEPQGGKLADSVASRSDFHDLGSALEPALLAACQGRLRDVHWFRTDWQIGGASTAYGKYAKSPGEPPLDVVIKLPVGPREYRFLTGLADTHAPTPRVAQHGNELGGYDFAWVVMERLPGSPPAAHLHKEVFERLTDAAAHFQHHCAARWPIEPPPPPPDWVGLLDKARDAIKANPEVASGHEWLHAIKHTHKALPRLESLWSARAINTWRHGDLHPGNCMERLANSPWNAPPGYVLFDLAEVSCGHWIEDAVYLERIYWGHPEILDGAKPVSLLARARRNLGLDTSDDYGALANVRRVLMAATSPAFLRHEGRPAYLHAALGMIDRLLPQLTK